MEGAKNRNWAACPDMLDSSSSGSDDSTLSQNSLNDDPDEISFKKADPKNPIEVDVVVATHDKVEGATGEDSVEEIETSFLESDEEAMQEELRIKREEIQKLQDAVEQKNREDAEKVKKERRDRRQLRFEQDKAELERQEKVLRAQVVGLGGVQQDPGVRKNDLEKKVAEHEAKQQRKAAAKLAKRMEEQQRAAGLSLPGIRKDPKVREKVDKYINKLKEVAPTLSSDKTAGSRTDMIPQPAASQSPESGYVYVAELGQVVPVVGKVLDLPMSRVLETAGVDHDDKVSSDEAVCSSDEECDIEPGEGFRLVWRRHPDGNKYFEIVEDDFLPDVEKTYVLDQATGRYECKLRPVRKDGRSAVAARPRRTSRSTSAVSRLSSNQVHYRDHRVRSGSTRSRAQRTSTAPAKDDRMPSFVQTDSEKQGKVSQIPELVQYARDCPVHWTSKITTQNMNVVLWSWAYVAQLLASRTGQAPAYPDGELEARLQHFLSVLEVTLQTTNQTDFASDSWKVARLYHTKVQQKLDSGVTDWIQMYEQWGGSTLPHELMAANAEAAPAVYKRGGRKPGDEQSGMGGGSRGKDEKLKRLCSTWNKCETRGKCQWELDNEGEKCRYAHFCSYCKSKKLNPVNHQRHFCKKVGEDETE